VFAGIVVLLLFQAVPQTAPAPTGDDLRRGKNAFDRGEYDRAVEVLRPLLYPEVRLESEGEIVQAYRMLGVAELFQGNSDAAAQEFRKLLQVRPEYRFDPLLDPPQVVDLFNGVLHAHETEVATLEAKQREAARARQRDREECEKLRAGPSVVEKRFGRNSFALNFFPFGVGQFQNAHRRKGWAFLGVEASLAAVSVAALVTNFALYGTHPTRKCLYDNGPDPCQPGRIDHTDENRSRWLTRVQVASGAAFFAAVAWGIVDALYFYQPETPLALAPAGQPMTKSSVPHLLPVLVGDAIGPGLYFRF
jgi:tetratricopeptide (TPR) repeat protein